MCTLRVTGLCIAVLCANMLCHPVCCLPCAIFWARTSRAAQAQGGMEAGKMIDHSSLIRGCPISMQPAPHEPERKLYTCTGAVLMASFLPATVPPQLTTGGT